MTVVLLVVCAAGAVVFFSQFHPGRFGAPLVEGLTRVPAGETRGVVVTQVLDVEVVARPDPSWPPLSFGFQKPHTYWTRVRVKASAGQGAPPPGTELGLESRDAPDRFLVCLDATGAHIDGYVLETSGLVRLVGDASPAAQHVPYDATEPMPVQEAFTKLLGNPGSTIPTKFRP